MARFGRPGGRIKLASRVATTDEPVRPVRWGTVPEAAGLLRISVSHAYQLCAEGKLPAIKLGKVVRVDLNALDALPTGLA
jgi:excisionase family DNA binding protein